MALSPILVATLQAAAISAVSNIIAQAITAYQEEVWRSLPASIPDDHPLLTGSSQISLVIDWVPVVQFFIFPCIQTPPNFMW